MPTVLTVKNLLKSGALVLIGREVEHVLHAAERALPIALLAHVALLKLVAFALHVTGPLAAMDFLPADCPECGFGSRARRVRRRYGIR